LEGINDDNTLSVAGSRTSRNDHVHAPGDTGLHELCRSAVPRSESNQLLDSVGLGRELADGESGAVKRQRRNDCVDTRAVCEASVDIGRGFVDATAHLCHDLFNGATQLLLVEEMLLCLEEAAVSLHVDGARAVDHDLGDGVIFDQ
jgi:hypothetical protein